jgi:hypothetical protein
VGTITDVGTGETRCRRLAISKSWTLSKIIVFLLYQIIQNISKMAVLRRRAGQTEQR